MVTARLQVPLKLALDLWVGSGFGGPGDVPWRREEVVLGFPHNIPRI